MLFLNADGTVKSHQKISDTEGGFTGNLDIEDFFGGSAAALGDLNGDGTVDLAVGAHADDDGGGAHGAVWVLFLNTDGTVKSHQKISDTAGGFTGILDTADYFGWSTGALGDLDGDGVGDLAVGAPGDNTGGVDRGAVWILFINTDGTVKAHQKISDTEGGFTGDLDDRDQFGQSVGPMGDFDGDGVPDLAVGAIRDDDGGGDHGAVWVLFLDDVPAGGGHADLTAFTIQVGLILDGDLADLLDSDDAYVHTQSGFGETLIDLHHMEVIVSAETMVGAPSLIDLRFESRIDEPAGTAQVRLLNHNTQQFDFVGQYALGNTDTIDTIIDIDATNYVGGAGEIEMSIKHIVFVPFLAFTFESWLDWVEIAVE